MTETGTTYELAYLATPLLPEATLAEEVAKLKTAIEGKGGVIGSHEEPKMRPLAYTIIKKIANKNVRFSEAYFGWMQFTVVSTAVAEIEEWIKKNENIVRHMLIVAPKEQPQEEAEGAVEGAAPEAKADGLTDQELDREIDQMIAA